jgi:hypothetical protein
MSIAIGEKLGRWETVLSRQGVNRNIKQIYQSRQTNRSQSKKNEVNCQSSAPKRAQELKKEKETAKE